MGVNHRAETFRAWRATGKKGEVLRSSPKVLPQPSALLNGKAIGMSSRQDYAWRESAMFRSKGAGVNRPSLHG